jgi:flavodoxin
MKILVTYYTRTNNTKSVAKEIQKNLNCDIEEIIDLKNRSGFIAYIKSCFDALKGTPTEIKPTEKDVSEYDLVIVGTPVWASTMAPAILTYLKENKEKFKDVSFFCTCGSSGYDKTISKMEGLVNKKSKEKLFMTKSDIQSSFNSKIESFTETLENIS